MIIYQIRDREGFHAFESGLNALNIPFQLEEISDEIYTFSRSHGDMLLSVVTMRPSSLLDIYSHLQKTIRRAAMFSCIH